MTLDEMEKLATSVTNHDDEYRAFCKTSGNHYHESDAANLARALLAVLPVVRAAEAWRLGMVDGPPIRLDEIDLLRAIDTMHATLRRGI